MGKVYQLNTSRENWKDKAIGRGNTIRAQNREIKKLKKDNKKIKDELENKKISEASVNQNLLQKVGDEKVQTFYLILLLFLFGGIGFRAISRVLEILATFLNLGRAPCVQTCVNVVMKFSIAKMLTVKRIVTEKKP